MAAPLNLDVLDSVLAGDGAALRLRMRLQPAAGSGTKVFPPTYEQGRYAEETRRIGGREVPCVLLDSVASQANRMELALLDAVRAGEIPLPLIEVAFPDGLGIGSVTSLEAPHRIADAILRDAELEGTPFRKTQEGNSFTLASYADATALLEFCPTALVFGMWDSTGPRGGLGTKFARALVSEIVAIDAIVGTRTSSRIDPLQIGASAGPVYVAEDESEAFTLDEGQAQKKGSKPLKHGKDGKPSEVNHGNVTPTIEPGGVTMEYAEQNTTLSLPAVRRLGFPVSGERTIERDRAGQAAVAALGVAAASLALRHGLDLRSRCLLVADEPARWEIVRGFGQDSDYFDASPDSAVALLRSAAERARDAGLPWRTEPLHLTASDKMVELVRRTLAAEGGGGEEA